jgi:hypothetical protein
MHYLQKMHLLMQSNDTVLFHKNSMLDLCADGSEIDSYSSKMLMFAIVNIMFRLIIKKCYHCCLSYVKDLTTPYLTANIAL